MFESLELFDRQLLLAIIVCNSAFFDTLFYCITQTWASVPIFLLALYLLQRKYGWKLSLFSLACIALAIGCADVISTECFKKVICRYRPSHNLEIEQLVHIVRGYKGGMYGFVSSHAANMFAFAVFVSLLLKNKWWTIVFLFWTLIVCYTRMYLGVHYPADIVCGALVGCLCAVVFYCLERRVVRRGV
ncbi:MAG: phosphatase PAP2 family protein [Bacteroidales bacterium]|nr:phosphatase PAP2 family protein [Bacteroidales bacterium]